MSIHKEVKKVTTNTLLKLKAAGQRISMLTAYDFSFAKIFDAAGIDVILVGDSASNVMAGHETTLPITLDQMIYHACSVVRGVARSLVVVDLPFGTYQSNSDIALASAIRIMKETGAHALKLEGGVRANNEKEAEKLKNDILILQEAGCFACVLEKIPAALAREVTASVVIPTIGIGAGNGCDGQVLVMHDMLGINNEFSPRFLRKYLDLHQQITNAVEHYIADVKSGDFPNDKESY